MERKKKFFRNKTIVKRILCFVFAFTLVVTMGAFSNLDGTVVKADESGNTLTVHFKNALEWEKVYAMYGKPIEGKDGWESISGCEAALENYGINISASKDEKNPGWYTHTVSLPSDISAFGILFNNGSWETNNHTPNCTMSISGDAEVWIVAKPKESNEDTLDAADKAPEGWNTSQGGDSGSEEYGKLINGALTEDAEGEITGWSFKWEGSINGVPDNKNVANTWYENGAYNINTTDRNEKSTVTISQTVKIAETGAYQAGVAIVGTGTPGSEDYSRNALTLTVKNTTANTEKTVQLVTNGWNNWDNVVKTEALEASVNDELEITISGTLTGKDWYALKNVTLSNTAEGAQNANNNGLLNGALEVNDKKINNWTVKWEGILNGDPDNNEIVYTNFWEDRRNIETKDGNETSKITISQTVNNVAAGNYQAGVAIVGNGEKDSPASPNALTLTVKNITAGTEVSKQLVTNGYNNFDNVVKTEALEAGAGDDLEITISGTLTGKDWYALKNVTLVNTDNNSGDDDNNDNDDDTDTAVDAPISVEKVKGLSEDFIHGVDLSTHLSQLQSGVKYYDENGNEADIFDILEDAGVNYVRLRVWNCPFRLDAEGHYTYVESDGKTEHSYSEVADENGVKNGIGFTEYFLKDGTKVYRKSYGAGICDVATAAVIGKMATDHNMKVLIDFHYSDFWADPNKRSVPKEWDGLNPEEKGEALYQFTKESLETLLDAGVNVGMVQIGNEMNNGLAGEKTHDNVHALLKRGSQAIREVSDEKNHEILIAVHFTNPNEEKTQLNRAWELEQAGVDYDVFGTSYYPYWHGDAKIALTEHLGEIAKTYNKKVMVCEVAYLWTTEDGDGYGNMASGSDSDKTYKYPISVEGQATAIRDTIAAVSAIGENGLGTFYWEPAWVPVNGNKYDPNAADAAEIFAQNVIKWKVYGSGWASIYADDYDYEIKDEENGCAWDNQTLFDFNGKALPSLKVYKYVYTGADGPTIVSSVDSVSCEMQYGEEPKLPQTVTVNLNNGTTVSAPVTWDAEQTAALKTADFGEHTVSGAVGAFSYLDDRNGEAVEVAAGTWKATCNVKITGHNYVFNGGFEEGEADNKESHAAGWKLTVYGDMNESPRAEPGAENAKNGDWFYQGWQDKAGAVLDFAIDQDIARDNLPNGEYMLFAYYQGTGVKETLPQATLYAVLTYKDGTSKTLSAPIEFHNVWKDYYQAKVRDIFIDDSVASVQVGTRLACSWAGSGSWVTVDDISLMKMKDLEPEEDIRLVIPVTDDYTEVIDTAGKVDAGTTITVKMADTTVAVPAALFNAIQGKDINIIFEDNDGGFSWTINGKSVTAVTTPISLNVELNTKGIPVDKVNKIAGSNKTMQVSLTYDGSFNFKANLTLNVGNEYAGKYANLFYYNESNGNLEYQEANRVTSDGKVTYTFTHASDYVIVFADTDMKPQSSYDGWAGVSAEQKAKLMRESLAQTQNAAVAAPKTNDNAPVAIVLMLLMAGAVAVAGAVAKKRRLC